MVREHSWLLAGPWYRWEPPGVPGAGRISRPAIQKFSSDDFVKEFLREPQHSLKFDPDVDQVYAVHLEPATLLTGALKGKFASFYPGDANGDGTPSRTKLVPSGVLKLFLDLHSRHYLVVCELHCDVPGFPSPDREKICQAGFVVRRRYMSYSEAGRPIATKLLKEIIGIQAKLAELDETAPLRPSAAKRRTAKISKMKEDGAFLETRQNLVKELDEVRNSLGKWKADYGARTILQGWVPGKYERIGAWQFVEEEPLDLTEAWSPLYSVFADPADPDHDAQGRTLFFGNVPTSSFDTDTAGKARFDSKSVYEIRCFVRRHDPECPRKLEAPDCHGLLTWSKATENYQLAAPFDLEGTANRPVTIQMPDLAELAAQAINRPFGKYSPVKVIQPQGLVAVMDGTSVKSGKMGGEQICFFSIPLITIVALFVLSIFLPIVVYLFGLWFLLAFKFCIPPSISVNLGLQAELNALLPKVDTAASVQVDFDLDGIKETKTALDLNDALQGAVSESIAGTTPLAKEDVKKELDQYANSPLIALQSNYSEVAQMPRNVKNDPPVGVDYTASLEYEKHVDLEVPA